MPYWKLVDLCNIVPKKLLNMDSPQALATVKSDPDSAIAAISVEFQNAPEGSIKTEPHEESLVSSNNYLTAAMKTETNVNHGAESPMDESYPILPAISFQGSSNSLLFASAPVKSNTHAESSRIIVESKKTSPL